MKHKNTAYIDRRALTENYSAIENIVSSPVKSGKCCAKPRVICIVKADAYGHGVSDVARTLGDAGCGFFGVSSEEEAHELRQIESSNSRHPEILILSRISPENVGDMIEDDITCAVVSYENARELLDAVREYRKTTCDGRGLKIHIKLDTGMNRVGFPVDDEHIEETVREVTSLATSCEFDMRGIFTHFSSADDELLDTKVVRGYEECGGYTMMQLSRFKHAVSMLEERGVDVGLKHAANSAAILCLPQAYFDAVRAGIIIYGLLPNGATDSRFSPVMRFESTVTHIHRADAGEKVSYGATYTLTRPTLIATVAAGYADGFERAYGGCRVKINGKMYPQIGRICMDQFMVDITPENGCLDDADVKVGDAVTLFGGDDGTMTNALARIAGTINYEVVCKVSKRVRREVI